MNEKWCHPCIKGCTAVVQIHPISSPCAWIQQNCICPWCAQAESICYGCCCRLPEYTPVECAQPKPQPKPQPKKCCEKACDKCCNKCCKKRCEKRCCKSSCCSQSMWVEMCCCEGCWTRCGF